MITLTARITLADGSAYEVNKRNILYLDSEIVDRSDIAMPSVGIISNRGSLRFMDFDGKIDRLIATEGLSENYKCELFLTDTLSKAETSMGEFYATDWQYDSNSKEVSVTLVDDLVEWQEIEINGFDLGSETIAYMLYDALVQYYVPSKWSFKNLDTKTYQILNDYKIEYPYLKKGNLWSYFNKICEACGLHIFKNRENKVVVSYDFRGE
jgi:hypothetical protein